MCHSSNCIVLYLKQWSRQWIWIDTKPSGYSGFLLRGCSAHVPMRLRPTSQTSGAIHLSSDLNPMTACALSTPTVSEDIQVQQPSSRNWPLLITLATSGAIALILFVLTQQWDLNLFSAAGFEIASSAQRPFGRGHCARKYWH